MKTKFFLIASLLLIIPFITRADGGEGCFYMMDWYGREAWSIIFISLFWVIIIGGTVFFFHKKFMGKNIEAPPATTKSALEILQERYAKGEINKEQFEAVKKDIEK